MKHSLRLRLRYRTALYWLGRLDPRTWPSSLRTARWRRRVDTAHTAALLHPYRGANSDSLPAIEVAGSLVFVYLDRDHKALRVSVDLDSVAPWLLNDAERVPMLITVNGDEVFSADYQEPYAISRP
ncbi:hypothetical protein [Nocardia miyunensis]|uniref:hypothetical protein n=1 Tax=Nocardia miyunensis TaxID=282684 RepID=UPI000B0DAE80|nr:hypothetical protein [Nocardia miyunensis]